MTRATSGSVALTVTGRPAWRTALSAWQWYELSGTSWANRQAPDPNNGNALTTRSERIDAWNSIAVDRDTSIVYMARAGGHADWAGNEVYSLPLNVTTPTAPAIIGTGSVAGTISAEASYNTDGKPASTHLYYAMQICRARNRLMTFGSGSLWGNGNSQNNQVDAFRLADNAWDAADTFSDIPSGVSVDRGQCQDYATENQIVGTQNGFHLWTQSTATWSYIGNYAGGGGGSSTTVQRSPSAFDTTRNRALFTRHQYDSATNGGLLVTPSNNSVSAVSMTGANASNVWAAELCALEYVASLDLYYLKTATGATLYSINPTTWATLAVSTTGTPPNAVNGNFNRFRHVPNLGGFIYVPNGTNNLWFLATD